MATTATDKSRIIRDIKTGGSIGIYIGTASIMKPIVKQQNQNRSALGKMCSVISGTVISCGVSHIASNWFGKMVDKVADFIDDVTPRKKEETHE